MGLSVQFHILLFFPKVSKLDLTCLKLYWIILCNFVTHIKAPQRLSLGIFLAFFCTTQFRGPGCVSNHILLFHFWSPPLIMHWIPRLTMCWPQLLFGIIAVVFDFFLNHSSVKLDTHPMSVFIRCSVILDVIYYLQIWNAYHQRTKSLKVIVIVFWIFLKNLIYVVPWVRNGPHRITCLNVWSLVGRSIWEVVEPVGGSVLLEEGYQLWSALTPMSCFLHLLPVKMKMCPTYLSAPVAMHAVPIMVDHLVHKLKSQQKKSN